MFSCAFCEISKKSFFYRIPLDDWFSTFQSLTLEYDTRGKLESALFLIKFAMSWKILWKLFVDHKDL